MAEQEQNRTEPATPFKLAEARKQGQVAKSLDFNSFVIVFALLLLLSVLGGHIETRVAVPAIGYVAGGKRRRARLAGRADSSLPQRHPAVCRGRHDVRDSREPAPDRTDLQLRALEAEVRTHQSRCGFQARVQ